MIDILFIQGGGYGGYEADKSLVASLQAILGKAYNVHYPEILSDESAADYGWVAQIEEKIKEIKNAFILMGHSFGASMILKYLSEYALHRPINGIFLIATPFWSGDEDWKQGLKLQKNYDTKLPAEIPIFFYHCQDDEEVPIAHLHSYKQKLTQATFRVIENGGHQLKNRLSIVASDIKSLAQ
jgi:predicted alpha/beta hydrolase family esterase